MVVDTSALMAILMEEIDAPAYVKILQKIEDIFMSAGSLLESGTVLLNRQGSESIVDLYEVIEFAQIEVVPVSERHARAAIDAYARFGKCTRHPAQLNYGDCFSYALAKALDRPLLYKGEDFAKTDVRSAL